MLEKLMIVTMVIIIVTNIKIFISELKRDIEHTRISREMEELIQYSRAEFDKLIEREKNRIEDSKEEPKKRRGRPKKEEEK